MCWTLPELARRGEAAGAAVLETPIPDDLRTSILAGTIACVRASAASPSLQSARRPPRKICRRPRSPARPRPLRRRDCPDHLADRPRDGADQRERHPCAHEFASRMMPAPGVQGASDDRGIKRGGLRCLARREQVDLTPLGAQGLADSPGDPRCHLVLIPT